MLGVFLGAFRIWHDAFRRLLNTPMSDVAIRVENLTKKFYLGERVGIKTFREALQDLVTAPFRIWKKGPNGDTQEKVDTEREIWALKGVSFEVKHGEVLGIIGPNGAGKSTLLKILSRITEPTGGYAEIRGRVGSLLEVGTGFHPELTGRENVYLNGAILGMSKAEIRRKFDDIVSFAGVEKFIDTPVKRYSSGMQVRLAFAVAAHLEPEILIIDEVLAVGDAEFQKRCLGKMNEVSRSGRTVLFVSHNMAAVEGLCTRAMLLKCGSMALDGIPADVISEYLGHLSYERGGVDIGSVPRTEGRLPVFTRIRFLDANLKPIAAHVLGQDLIVELVLNLPHALRRADIALKFYGSLGQRVITCNSWYHFKKHLTLDGEILVRIKIEKLRLAPGVYTVSFHLSDDGHIIDAINPGARLSVVFRNDGTEKDVLDQSKGCYIPEVHWTWSRIG